MLKDTADKIGSAEKAAIESAMEAVKTATSGSDAAAIQRALDELTQAQHKAAENLYKQQAAGGGQGGGGTTGGDGAAGRASSAPGGEKTGDVIDAEVVDEGKQ